MKKIMISMAIALTMSLAMQAQDAPRHHRGQGHDIDPKKMVEMKVERMEKELNLSAKQKEAIFEIYMKEAQMMEQNFKERAQRHNKDNNQQSAPRGEKKPGFSKMQDNRAAVNARINEVLNDEQRAKFAELEKERFGGKHHMKPRGGHKKGEGDCKNECCDGKKSEAEGKCAHENMKAAEGKCNHDKMCESKGKCELEKKGANGKQCANENKKTEE